MKYAFWAQTACCNPGNIDYVHNFLKDWEQPTLWLSFSKLWQDKDAIKRLAPLRRDGIRIEALVGDKSWVISPKTAQAQSLKTYVEWGHEHFDGIHFDVEPWATTTWRIGGYIEKQAMIRNYIALLGSLHAQAIDKPVTLSMVPQMAKIGLAGVEASSILAAMANSLALMIYNTKPHICRNQTANIETTKYVPFWSGFSVDAQKEPGQSYAGQTKANIIAALERHKNEVVDQFPLCQGIAINDLGALMEIWTKR
jgi:hypothetical protein